MSATFHGMLCASNTQGNNVYCGESPFQEHIDFMDAIWQVEACMPSFNIVSLWSRKTGFLDHNDTTLKDACKWHARFHLPNCIHEVDLFLYNELNTFTTN